MPGRGEPFFPLSLAWERGCRRSGGGEGHPGSNMRFAVLRASGDRMTAHMPIVRCAGAPRRRGEAHGEALRALIQATQKRWLDHLERAGHADPHIYLRE